MPQNLDITRRSSGYDPIYSAMRGAATQGQQPVLQQAVVFEVFSDLVETQEFIEYVKGTVINPWVANIAPPNSVVAKLISNSAGNAETGFVLLFPIFSSHHQLPISPGEVVSVIFTDGGVTGNSGIGFWVDSLRGASMSDDPNYTHYDRIYDPTNNFENYDLQERNSINQGLRFDKVVFNNGPEHNGIYTLNQPTLDKNPYDVLVQNSFTNKFSTFEPIPRIRKRPNEYILQAKNNSLILLGEDRSGLRNQFESGTSGFDNKKGAAILDLVVGRGRTPATAPNLVANTRGNIETNKVPFKYGKRQNPQEGDPDFNNDAARILIAQRSKVDERFGILEQTTPQSSKGFSQPEELQGKILTTDNGAEYQTPGTNNSYVAAKADHVRVIARANNEVGTQANGSILLLREGDISQTETLKVNGPNAGTETQSKGLSYILLTEEGVQINGKLIHFGPAGEHQNPMILWTNYVDVINDLQNQIKDVHKLYGEQIIALQTTLLMLCQTLSAVFAAANTCPPGGPNGAIAASVGILQNTVSQIVQANAVGDIIQSSTELLQKQIETLDKAKAENQSQIIFNS